jgi:chromosomal replication initiation ATPase DnaA
MERCDYCGSILKIGNVSEFLEKIIKLINDDQLNVPSRSQVKCHRRYYLFHKMRERGLSLQQVGDYFGRDHATVLHGVKMHNTYTEQKDFKYLKDTEEYDNLFQDNQ